MNRYIETLMNTLLFLFMLVLTLVLTFLSFSYFNVMFQSPIEDEILKKTTHNYFITQQDKTLHLKEKFNEKFPDTEFYNVSVNEFKSLIWEEYLFMTSDMSNPCQYYAYLWSEYLEYHDLEYTFINTNTHVFVMMYDKDSYTILDQHKVYKTKFN